MRPGSIARRGDDEPRDSGLRASGEVAKGPPGAAERISRARFRCGKTEGKWTGSRCLGSSRS